MTIEAVIFDLGGTLLHYHDAESPDAARPFRRITLAGYGALLQALRELGYDVPATDAMAERLDEEIRRTYLADLDELRGGTIETPVQAALAAAGVQLDPEAWQQVRSHFYNRIDEIVSPREGMLETLQALRERGYKLGLISNTYWAADLHDQHLAEHGLLDFLPVRVYSCDAAHRKPHPSIFKLALDALGVEPGEAAYVGDRPDVDVAGAQQVGMHGILIRSPHRPEADEMLAGGVTPDAVIGELPELVSALEQLEGQRA